MEVFNFDLFLQENSSGQEPDEFLDSVEDVLFEAFQGDVTPGIMNNIPLLFCTIEADSQGLARNKVVSVITELGFYPNKC